MRIGILGSGKIGGTVGRLWAKAGHEVRFSSRHPEQLGALVASAGPAASASTLREAAEFAEAVLIAVPLKAIPQLAEEVGGALHNKLVLDASNPYLERDGEVAREALEQGKGSSSWTASKLSGARVVKAFNMQRSDVLEQGAHDDEDPLAIMLAGDDLTAIGLAKQLVQEAGFEPVVVGSLEEGRSFDPGGRYYAKGVRAAELRRDMAESRHAR
ncbi:MAG TPA: NAD(P)-binding domain-containing protein [Polyangiaceae bacterium]